MSKTTLRYKDIAPRAEGDASISSTGASAFSTLAALPHGAEGITAATAELNQWGLNGAYAILDKQPVAFWSSALSGADCLFAGKPVITATFSQQHSSVGITLVFDTAAGGYCTALNIKWYQGAALKADMDFTPTGPAYFCRQKVSSYDRVVITLLQTNLPHRYARVEHLIFGANHSFGMSELRKASIVNEMHGIAAELPVSTLRWTLDSLEEADFMFQLKQPVEVRNDSCLIGVYYIDDFSRLTQNVYDIACYDAFGVLGESPFAGGVYSAKSAKALLSEIVGANFAVISEAPDRNLTGILLPCTRREAAQQVLFAWGVDASTDGRDNIRVFLPGSAAAVIGTDKTFPGVSVDTASVVTSVRVSAHTYTQDANGGVEVGGVKYRDAETIYTVTNPNATANDKQNVVEVTGATLVSTSIGQTTAQRVYDYCQRRNTAKAKIVWAGQRLGDCVTLPNAWGSTNTGNITKMEISLSNTVVANIEAR